MRELANNFIFYMLLHFHFVGILSGIIAYGTTLCSRKSRLEQVIQCIYLTPFQKYCMEKPCLGCDLVVRKII